MKNRRRLTITAPTGLALGLGAILFTQGICSAYGALTLPSLQTPQSKVDQQQDTSKTLEGIAARLAAWRVGGLTGVASTPVIETIRRDAHEAFIANSLAPTSESERSVALIAELESAWIEHLVNTGSEPKLEAALASLAAAEALATTTGGSPLARARSAAAEHAPIKAKLAGRRAQDAEDGVDRASLRQSSIGQAVGEAMAVGDTELVYQLGKRAVPTLVALVRADPLQRNTNLNSTPLQVLLRIDPIQGLDLCHELVKPNDLLVKRAVAEAIGTGNTFRSKDEVWNTREARGDLLKKPEWLTLVDILAQDPAVSDSLLKKILEQLMDRGYLPESLHATGLRVLDRKRAGARGKGRSIDLREYFVKATTAENPNLREDAALYFPGQMDRTPMYAMAAEQERTIVKAVAQSFGTKVERPYAGDKVNIRELTSVPTVDDAYVEGFRTFVRSQETGWTKEALREAKRTNKAGGGRLPVEVLLEIVNFDIDDDHERTELNASLLSYLGGYPVADQKVVHDQMLAELIESPGEFETVGLVYGTAKYLEMDLFWPFATELKTNDLITDEVAKAMTTCGPGDASLYAAFALRLIGWAADEGPKNVRDSVVQRIEESRSGRLSPIPQAMADASPEARDKAVRQIVQFDSLNFQSFKYIGVAPTAACWEAIVLDERANPDARMQSIDMFHSSGGGQFSDRAGVESAYVNLVALTGSAEHRLHNLTKLGLDPQSVLRRLLANDAISDEVMLAVEIDRVDDPALVKSIQQRFPIGELKTSANVPLLYAVGRTLVADRAADRSDELIHAVRVNRHLAEYIAVAVLESGDARHLPVLTAFLDAQTWMAAEDNAWSATWKASLGRVSSSMSDESAQFLIASAQNDKWTDAARQMALDKLEGMMKLREATARWERGAGATASRAKALRGLTAILDDAQAANVARIEAVRGLGLLGAAEELPRLIALLQSGDERVAAAAREAIDQIHASAKEGTK